MTSDKELASSIEDRITHEWSSLCPDDQSYGSLVKVCESVGKSLLPSQTKRPPSIASSTPVNVARTKVLTSLPTNLPAAQSNLRSVYDEQEDLRVNNILSAFDEWEPTNSIQNAWKLVKQLSGKRPNTVFIQGDDRLASWKSHFEKLLNSDNASNVPVSIDPVFEPNPNIPTGKFSQAEVNIAIKQMKLGKAPGLDNIPIEVWRLPKLKKYLTRFCNATLEGNRPPEWGLSGIVPVPKKGDLTIPDNYRGISLSQTAAKVYNRLLLNRIRPEVEKILRPNQSGFRPLRSTASQILALRRLIEEIRNHQKEAAIIFIDFRKAFDSVDRPTMFKILHAYGIPEETINAIKIMYEDTSAVVLTPEGESDSFSVNTGVLQGDPLAPYLFIIVLDYALRTALNVTDGLTLSRRRSSRHPAQYLSDLDYADDISLLADTLLDAESLLHKVEACCKSIGLSLNAKKTKYMVINPSTSDDVTALDGSKLDKVDDFKYLGSYTNTARDIECRKAQAWSALFALTKVWRSSISMTTKLKIFKTSIESILLYGCESWTLTKQISASIDGTYTRMLRAVQNVSWQQHLPNSVLYGALPPISTIIRQRRLRLAGHVYRHNEPASQVLLWNPEAPRRKGRPNMTLKTSIELETGLSGPSLSNTMLDRDSWAQLIKSS